LKLPTAGTLFLDEIGDMPQDMQAKLLRVIEHGEFERLGSAATIKVDVRLVAATNQDLVQKVIAGQFREDLCFRLNVFPIRLPPLRERADDIPLLVWAFVREFEKKLAGKKIQRIPQKHMQALQKYRWPGNVRELRNVIENAMITSAGKTLRIRLPAAAALGNVQVLELEKV
jgi:DNA-binding NtrC family response regulator